MIESDLKRKRRGTHIDDGDDDDDDDDEGDEKEPRHKKAPLSTPSPISLGSGKYNRSAVEEYFPGYDAAASAPTRERPGGAFRFAAAAGASEAEAARVAAFRPNRSPEEVMRAGAFGGTYFRTISSSVTKQTYKDQWKELPETWTKGLNAPRVLSRPWDKYDVAVNKYGAKCGQTLEDWQSNGWMSHHDPFGWFQWYCRFFMGRRCDDDERQIGRWLKCCGPTGRWKSNLCGKVVIAQASYDDASVSPVVRQTLLHWAYELTEEDFAKGRAKIMKGKGATYVSRAALDAAVANQKNKGKKRAK